MKKSVGNILYASLRTVAKMLISCIGDKFGYSAVFIFYNNELHCLQHVLVYILYICIQIIFNL